MNPPETRMRARISTGELERRWQAVREAMREKGLDYLIMQNYSLELGGYVRWFTDIPCGGYRSTVIFPREEEMTTIWHGPRPPAEPGPPAWMARGVKKRIGVPIVPSLGYTAIYDAEKVVEELAPHKGCRFGLVGMGFISASFYKYIKEHLDSAVFEDASDLVDNIKAVRSDEEIELGRQTCKLQDDVWAYIITRIQPGRKEYEIYAEAIQKAAELGAEQSFIAVGTAPAGTAARMMPHYLGNKVIEAGDQLIMLIETNGPGGLWGELARTACLGKIPPALEEQFALTLELQQVTLDNLMPGNSLADIWHAHNEFLRGAGYPEETRLFTHNQGYDMVERPSAGTDETMLLAANMNMAVHPEVASAKAHGWVSENYVIKNKGAPECLHGTPQKLFVI
ncbi:M24 family metallopeptidase [Chloroflexota bacterium]